MGKPTEEEDDQDDALEGASPGRASSPGSTDGDESEEDGADEEGSDEEDSDHAEDEDEDSGDEAAADANPATALDVAARSELAATHPDDAELPTQLGSARYVFAAFFGFAILVAFITGKTLHGLWAHFANRDFFALNLPQLTAVTDDAKETYSMAVGALFGIVLTLRMHRRQSVRDWSDAVSSELVKVKWPSRKEVQASTIVVLATSAVATTYLFLLDRFWGFVTDLIYKSGT